ncbi:MAG: 2-hydroxychromene-2-carboxylate isomerase [Rhizobiaceae bacterium]|nr:2-hydroxychromene-2-carboxylate isomerase [Rhizobiaceae bacterium]
MAKTVEFYFDIVSPASYLAWTQIPKLLEETGADIVYKPFFLPGVFEGAGSSSPITVPPKSKWLFHDLNRWAKTYDVPFVMNKHFPLSSVYAMRGLNNYVGTDKLVPLGNAMFDAMWATNQNINDPSVMETILAEVGIDQAEYMEKLNDPSNKQALVAVGEEAVSRGVFGAPTFFVGKFMHWGQDRLQFVKEDLLA